MAKLVNMALPKPKKGDKSTAGSCVPTCCGKEDDGPKYPYGLEISLDSDAIKALGLNIKDFDAGAVVQIQAKAQTTRVSDEDTQHGGKRLGLGFQITDIAITREGEDGFQKGWDDATKGKAADKAADKAANKDKGNG